MELDEAVAKTKDFCNEVRKLADEVEIEDLLSGIPGHAYQCVVAESLNCGLSVRSLEATSGFYMTGSGKKRKDLLLAVAENFNLEHVGGSDWGRTYLPDYVGLVVQAFDNGDLDEYELRPEEAA